MSRAPLIGLLTDFGQADGYVGTMKAVILGIAPGMPLVDLSHDIPPQDVAAGAWVLGAAWRYFPEGSVLLCVVDPGVGSVRQAIALEVGGRRFVGPDNGLFTRPLIEEGAGARCVTLNRSTYHLPATSATFHGRDIFAPCAAWLATGAPLDDLGDAVDVASLVMLDQPAARREGNVWVGQIVHIDHYGNLISNLGPHLVREAFASPNAVVTVGGVTVSQRATHFAAGPEGEPFWLRDSSGTVAVVVKNGSAARMLGARRGDVITLSGAGGDDI